MPALHPAIHPTANAYTTSRGTTEQTQNILFLSSALHACLARNNCISSEKLFSIPECPVTAPRKLGQGPAPCSKCRVVKWQQKQVLLYGISKAGIKQDVKVGHNKGTGKSVTSLCRLLGSCTFLSSLGSFRTEDHSWGIPGDQGKLTDLKIDQKVTADQKKMPMGAGMNAVQSKRQSEKMGKT